MAVKSRLWSPHVLAETRQRGENIFRRFGAQYLLDALSWGIALVLAEYLRYSLIASRMNWMPLVALILVAAALQLVLGWAFSLYRGRYRYGTFEEVQALLYSAVSVALVAGIPIVIIGTRVGIPRSTVLISLPIAFVLMGAARYVKRLVVEYRAKPGAQAHPTLIYGAGYTGNSLVRRMMTDRRSPFRPVGLIDDDRSKRNLTLAGVRVLGTGDDLERIVEKTGATTLVISIARADSALLRRIADAATSVGLTVKVLPLLDEMLHGTDALSNVRDISIEDLIGRHPVDTNVESIAGYLTGKRVLVTGAGGSIGSELCRQIVKFAPAELMMLDRDETALQQVEISIAGHGLLDAKDVVLADIRDREALDTIFVARRPEVVFHAAALKHLPMLEQYPDEAWKTNVLGTLNVLRAAQDIDVSTFVNVSTDKAANPTSVLGHSKRVAEKLTAWAAGETRGRFLSVRFGNVIGSRGSMLPTFQALIEAGGPLTVTHPDVTRYFMTIPEACQLVVQAGGIGDPGQVLILDMGEPVRILDVAERMVAASGKNIEIVFTGLRDGEKLHEELIGLGETDYRPVHPKISHATISAISPLELSKEGWEHRVRTNGADTAIVEIPAGDEATR